MDFKQLSDHIDKRLEKIEDKLDKLVDHDTDQKSRIAVIESKVAGFVKAGALICTAIVSIITFLIKEAFK